MLQSQGISHKNVLSSFQFSHPLTLISLITKTHQSSFIMMFASSNVCRRELFLCAQFSPSKLAKQKMAWKSHVLKSKVGDRVFLYMKNRVCVLIRKQSLFKTKQKQTNNKKQLRLFYSIIIH